mmetsp:Transcript_45359/g.95165  ORF Transcript_45359/g.95165 Transcript_45359/m.95165 type:complete len:304 (-) Transcript_45359:846-1757(-)
MDAHGLHSLEEEVFVYIIYVTLLFTKYDYGGRRLLQTFQEVHNLRLLFDIFHLLYHIQVGSTSASHVHHNRPHQRLLGKILKLFRKCGRIQDRLSLMMKVIHDLSHLLIKPQVEHAIRLVEANVPTNVQVDRSLLQKIAQTARRGHDAVHPPLAELLELIAAGFAADEQLGADSGIRLLILVPILARVVQGRAKFRHHIVGLAGQFAGGGEDDSHGSLSGNEGHARLLLHRRHDEGEGEAQRLAASREGDPHHVSSAQCHRQALHLNGRGSLDIFTFQHVQDRLGKCHLHEAANGWWAIVPLY